MWQTPNLRQKVLHKVTRTLAATGQDPCNGSAIENQLFCSARSKEEYMDALDTFLQTLGQQPLQDSSEEQLGTTRSTPIAHEQENEAGGESSVEELESGNQQTPAAVGSEETLIQQEQRKDTQLDTVCATSVASNTSTTALDLLPNNSAQTLAVPVIVTDSDPQPAQQENPQVIGIGKLRQPAYRMRRFLGIAGNAMATGMPAIRQPANLLHVPRHVRPLSRNLRQPGVLKFVVRRGAGVQPRLRIRQPRISRVMQPQKPAALLTPRSALEITGPPQMPTPVESQQQDIHSPPQSLPSTPPSDTANIPISPASPEPQPSHMKSHNSELCTQKFEQLSKYIAPMKRKLAQLDCAEVKQITKLRTLLSILCNRTEPHSYEALLRCEMALKDMDPFLKTANDEHPLVAAVSKTLQSPLGGHILQCTFRPSLENLPGPEAPAPPQPKVPRMDAMPLIALTAVDDDAIPHALQGEIERLYPRFRVTLDPAVPKKGKLLRLKCCLTAANLPSVPDISLDIPAGYPWTSPKCVTAEPDYMDTEFLRLVYATFKERIAKLPALHSLTHVLGAWEIAVRQACVPGASSTARDFDTIYADLLF